MMRKLTRLFTATLLTAMVATVSGCGSDDTAAAPTETAGVLEGIYRYEVTPDYLISRGVSEDLAREEGGVHTIKLDGGEFKDSWRNAQTSDACGGTYEIREDTVTFRWTFGCYGDWSMTFNQDGDRVRFSDIRSMPPYDDPETSTVNEAFNSVPWLRIG